MKTLTNLSVLLSSWAVQLPPSYRKAIYKGLKYVAGAATLALLVLPYLPGLGINIPTLPNGWTPTAILTAVLFLATHLADSNTQADPPLDALPAPEDSSGVLPPTA